MPSDGKLPSTAASAMTPLPVEVGDADLSELETAPSRELQLGRAGVAPAQAAGRGRMHMPAALKALRHRNFRLFWTGNLVSLIGTWMQVVARGWLVLELTHSAFWLGMVGFANSVPVLLFSLWGGAVADRVSKRVLVIWTQSIMMVAAFWLAVVTFVGVVDVWQVLLASLVTGLATAVDTPARQAFTVELVGKDDLMNAVALNSSIFNGARVAGPAIGAVVLAWQGPGMAFFLNGASFLAVIYSLFRIELPGPTRNNDRASAFRRIREGLSYVRHNQVIATLMILIVVTSIFAFPYTLLMPVFADNVLHVGQEGYGTLMAFSGIGSLIGAVSLAIQSGRQHIRRGRIIFLGSIGLPLFLGVFSISQSYVLSLLLLIGVGWTMISINATMNTVIQTTVPDELRGRVSGVYTFLFIGMAPFGNLQAGIVANYFGAPAAVGLGAIICALVTIFLFWTKRQVATLE